MRIGQQSRSASLVAALLLGLLLSSGCKPPAESYFRSACEKYYNADYEGAIADCTEAIRLEPDFAEAYYNRGLARLPQKT
jgi:tetratricopeptide (TPR) repeat protein